MKLKKNKISFKKKLKIKINFIKSKLSYYKNKIINRN